MPTSNHTHWPSGTTPILAENGIRFSVSESGFDTMNMKYYARTDTPIAYAKTNFDVGISVGTVLGVAYANMFFNGVSINQDGSNIYSFEAQAAGLLNASQPVKRTVSSKIQSYKTGLGTVPGSSPAKTGEIQGQYINLSCTFHQVTTSFPNTATRPENATHCRTSQIIHSPRCRQLRSTTTHSAGFRMDWRLKRSTARRPPSTL